MKVIDDISQLPDCIVLPPRGIPVLPDGKRLPADIEEFYGCCGGATLFANAPYGFEIVSPCGFVKANPVIALVDDPSDRSDDWFIVAQNGQQYVSIDCGSSWNGRCYDSFWDRHAVAGSCPVIASSFGDFLQRVLDSNGQFLYWLEPAFENLGDAYD